MYKPAGSYVGPREEGAPSRGAPSSSVPRNQLFTAASGGSGEDTGLCREADRTDAGGVRTSPERCRERASDTPSGIKPRSREAPKCRPSTNELTCNQKLPTPKLTNPCLPDFRAIFADFWRVSLVIINFEPIPVTG